jgi:hypothetical protein
VEDAGGIVGILPASITMAAMPLSTTRLLDLQPHPAQPAPPGISVVAGAEPLPGGSLRLGFVICGDPADLARVMLPEASAPIRVDGLWQRTCCEAFIAAADEEAYREFNFSPASAWAAYAFSAYRKAAALPLGPVPPIAFIPSGGTLTLVTTLAAGWLPRAPRLCMNLSLVLETTDGARSYWALAHPGAQPDFHHRDGFVLALEMNHEARP